MSAGGIDFVVIGAQKAATTTLYQWLRSHPALGLPASKESAFFDRLPTPSNDEYVRWFEKTFTGVTGTLLGKATPQYMCFDWAAENMARLAPELSLIALLRDPVERARSHWRMRTRMRTETRNFAEAVAELLVDRGDPSKEEDGYVAFGEYGRVLSRYLQHYPRHRVLVLEDTGMHETPRETLAAVCAFLSVPFHEPADGYTVRYNSGPTERRSRERILWKIFPYHLAQRVLPEGVKIRLGSLLDRFGVQRPEVELDGSLPKDLEERLRDHYRNDAISLIPILGRSPYWIERWVS